MGKEIEFSDDDIIGVDVVCGYSDEADIEIEINLPKSIDNHLYIYFTQEELEEMLHMIQQKKAQNYPR